MPIPSRAARTCRTPDRDRGASDRTARCGGSASLRAGRSAPRVRVRVAAVRKRSRGPRPRSATSRLRRSWPGHPRSRSTSGANSSMSSSRRALLNAETAADMVQPAFLGVKTDQEGADALPRLVDAIAEGDDIRSAGVLDLEHRALVRRVRLGERLGDDAVESRALEFRQPALSECGIVGRASDDAPDGAPRRAGRPARLVAPRTARAADRARRGRAGRTR